MWIWFDSSRVLHETFPLSGLLPPRMPANAPREPSLPYYISSTYLSDGHLVCWLGLEYPEPLPFSNLLPPMCLLLVKGWCRNITQQKQKHRIHVHCICMYFFLSLGMCLVWCKPSASAILMSQYLRFFHSCFRKPLQGYNIEWNGMEWKYVSLIIICSNLHCIF